MLDIYLSSSQQLVEDMVVALPTALHRDARQLQQVILNDAATDFEMRVETDLHEFTESGRIVVAHRLGVT
jgi:hypothetical protein